MKQISNYEDAVSYITSIPRFVNGNEYDRLRDFYQTFVREKMRVVPKIIHVAGTNGKGSVCSFLNSILSTMGKKVGMFTSPHLVDMRERITFCNQMIGREQFFDAFCEVRELLDLYNRAEGIDFCPTYFSWTFLIACLYYAKVSPDVVIWETGLGGRYDATNVPDRKDICIITEIGMDHMEYLGDTREKIAREKAGIMRKGVPVVFVNRVCEVTKVLSEEAEAVGSRCIIQPDLNNIKYEVSSKGIDFSYNSRYYRNANFTLGTLAVYQVENASLALAAIEEMYNNDEASLDILRQGISNMRWPGRMEEIAPGVVFDGAHNVDGIEALLLSVRNDGCEGKRYLLFSAVSDKQADIMLKMIAESKLFAQTAVTQINNSRGISMDDLVKLAEGMDGLKAYPEARIAYEYLLNNKEEDDILYVCGSLYLIGELKEWTCN